MSNSIVVECTPVTLVQWRIYVLVKGGGFWVRVSGCQRHALLGGSGACPPLGNVWNIGVFSCNLGHLLTNFRDSEKEFSAHSSVFHRNYSSALCWGMVGGIPSRKIDKFTCSLLDCRAFSGLNSNKFRSFLRNQRLPFPTFTNIMTNNCNMLKNGVRRPRQIRGPKIRANVPPKRPCWRHRVCHLGAIVVAWAARWRLGVGRI